MNTERFQEGRFSPSEAELEEIRKRAAAEGKDPEKAVAAFLEKLGGANARLEEKQSEAAIRSLEESLNETDAKKMAKKKGEAA